MKEYRVNEMIGGEWRYAGPRYCYLVFDDDGDEVDNVHEKFSSEEEAAQHCADYILNDLDAASGIVYRMDPVAKVI